jgi:hypothetical protein
LIADDDARHHYRRLDFPPRRRTLAWLVAAGSNPGRGREPV